MANIMILCGYWPSRDNPISGVFFAEQVRGFTDLGHRVWVVSGQAVGRRKALLSLEDLGLDPQKVTLLSPSFLRLPERISYRPMAFDFNLRSTGRMVRRAIRRIRKEGVTLDGCLAHDLRYAIASAPLWQPMLNRPAVGLIHGADPLLDAATPAPQIVSRLKDGLHRLTARGIVGSYVRGHLGGIGLNPATFQVVLNGTDLPTEAIPPMLGRDGEKTILSVARLCVGKGIDDVLRALGQLVRETGRRDWRYRIVGEGEERAALQRLAEDMDIAANVDFLGRLSRQETLAEFDRCLIFCLPSWFESFGIVYLEAMARARPAIGCDNCGAADFVTSGEDGLLVPPKSPEAIARALALLWDDPAQLERIAANGRRTAETLTWRRNAAEIAGLMKLDRKDGRR